jgi:class 3 adenylate cyclase
MAAAGERPTGTVSFLFSDIEGSTRLLQRLGALYAQALAEHQRLLREAFEAHGGHEIDTQGDSFFVANGRAVVFLSKRVGNFQYNPQLTTLLDQLWVHNASSS